MKVVIDTNVFVSGIFWKGESNRVLIHWKEGRITLIISAAIIAEFIKVMNDFKIQLPQDLFKEWLNMILRNSIMVEPKEKISAVKDDFNDNKFIEAAIAGDVEYIISQDKHLLKLEAYRNIKIVKPEEFNKLI
jgi:putative PIN family toxin of toxin-antitoxin system